MSKSFRDAVKQVMVEGAKEKTSDGMTPDAKHFRHDLHKVQDAGYKHMVQKDSETKDYEKMFKPAMEKMPVRLSDVEPDQGVNKYVEYNEAVRMQEAKKCMKGCTCENCSNKEDKADERKASMSDKKIAEASVMPQSAQSAIAARVATKAADAKQTSAISAREPAAPAAAKPVISYGGGQMGSTPSAVKTQTQQATARPSGGSAAGMAARQGDTVAGASGAKASAPTMAAGKAAERTTSSAAPTKFGGKGGAFDQARKAGLKSFEFGGKTYGTNIKGETGSQTSAALAKNKATSAAGASVTSQPATPKAGAGAGPGRAPTPMANRPAPTAGAGAGPGRAPTPPMKVAANPQASQAAGNAAQRGPTSPQGMSLAQYQAKRPGVGPGSARPAAQPSRQAITQSYEIEVNGQSYTLSETHAAAIAAYVEKYGINEKSDPNVGKFIHKEMQHPEKLTAKGKNQKIKQAIAIFNSKKRHGEKP